mgnify:CR=1 FL=1
MLVGEFRCSTDSEGRVPIPSAFRAELADGATVTRGIDRCLLVYPTREWQNLAQKIRVLPLTSQPARGFIRFIFSGANVCAPDQAGRLSLPEQLCQYAEIDGEVVLVGLLSHVEIWSPGLWEETRSSFVEEGAALAEQLSEFAI